MLAQAAGGTLFLDEVDSLTQGRVCLLRWWRRQHRPIGGRTGGCRPTCLLRLVVATNADLDLLVASGAFRADLFYRLSVFSVQLPPLANGSRDVLPLAKHFLKKHAATDRAAAAVVGCRGGDANNLYMAGQCPRAGKQHAAGPAICVQGPEVEAADLGLGSTAATCDAGLGFESYQHGKRRALAAFEITYLVRLMTYHKGNISQAAAATGWERRDR